MYQSITFNQFIDTFKTMNRDYYSYQGYRIIYDELETLFEGDYELDVIEICGTYSEYTEDELKNDYGVDHTFNNLPKDFIDDKVVGFTDLRTIVIRD